MGGVGSAEPFRDEDVAFCSGIWRDGGDAEPLVLQGGTHGYDVFAPTSSIARSTLAARNAWVDRIPIPTTSSP